jgi:mannose-6-phosphate isomerase-like protein (cupin superfamily)
MGKALTIERTEAASQVAPTKYTVAGTPLLASGIATISKAVGDNLWIHTKVYSRGGENALHAHAEEEHTFFVLQGVAEFEFADGVTERVEQYQGVFLPKGVLYKFQAQGEQNLVMLRVGAAQRSDSWSGQLAYGLPVEILKAVDERGDKIVNGFSAAKGRSPSETAVAIEGAYFPQA